MDHLEAKESITSRLELLASNGVFGEGHAVSIEFTETSKGPQFMSHVLFAMVRLSGGGETHVVVKIQENDEAMRKELDYDGFFHNEEHAYIDILPLIQQDSIDAFPKCYYGKATRGENQKEDMIIMEDIHKKGFTLSREVLSLDLDHLSLAVHTLGQFHGLSYKYKLSNGGLPIKNDLRNIRNPNSKRQLIAGMFNITLKKLEDTFKQKGVKCDVLEKVERITETVEDWVEYFSAPQEPFAVICHGDFNRNNIMFSYRHGRPVAVKFFDLQWATYSDPVVDLGFILYMNADAEMRGAYWDHLFQVYWSGVTSIAPDPGFSYDEFTKDFAKRVVLVLGEIAFFLPIMVCAKNKKPTLTPGETIPLPIEEQWALFCSIGGKEADDMIGSVARHMYERGYFDAFVEAITSK